MKTKKQTKFYLGRLIVLIVILLALVGCGGKETTKKETQNVVNNLEMQNKKEEFCTELEELNQNVVNNLEMQNKKEKSVAELEELKTVRLSRTYSEIMKNVEEFPQDISTQKYVSNLSEVLGSDLQKLEKGTVQEISYYDEFSELKITLNEDSSLKVILIEEKDCIAEIEDASLYSFDGRLIIYSRVKYTHYDSKRDLVAYFLTGNQDGVERCRDIDEINIDLCGVNIDKNDEIKILSEYAIVRKENSFLFYHCGNLLKEVEFPGGTISNKVFYDGYIVDGKNDLYYYYTNSIEKLDIIFWKAASAIDKIENDTCKFEFHTEFGYCNTDYLIYEGERAYYPIYSKNGKLYVTYSYIGAENPFGEEGNFVEYMKKVKPTIFCLDDSVIKYYTVNTQEVGPGKTDVFVNYFYIFDKNIKIERSVQYDMPKEVDKTLWDLEYKILSDEELEKVLNILNK